MNRKTFHHSKVFSGCSIEEHSWLWPTSENHKQRAPPLQQRPGKRWRIEGEVERGCREQLLTRATFGWFFYSKIWWQATTSGRPQGRLRRPNLKDISNKEIWGFLLTQLLHYKNTYTALKTNKSQAAYWIQLIKPQIYYSSYIQLKNRNYGLEMEQWWEWYSIIAMIKSINSKRILSCHSLELSSWSGLKD